MDVDPGSVSSVSLIVCSPTVKILIFPSFDEMVGLICG